MNSSSAGTQLSGNWQYSLSGPADNSFTGGLQGGFLLEKNGSITGQAVFSITLPGSNGSSSVTCNSGTANVTGSLSGQTVTLSAAVGSLDASGNPTTQTFTLTGQLGANNGTISGGTYNLTGGFYTSTQGQLIPCGTAQQNLTWSANSIPPITGGVQGFFHSTESTNGFGDQDFAVSGTMVQVPNIGASSSTVTGSLTFKDPASLLTDYPCLSSASVSGTISGDTVLLQIYSSSGAVVGQIGQTPGSGNPPNTVNLSSSASGGYYIHNSTNPGYTVSAKGCGSSSDSGNICLALNSSSACTQAITLSPFSVTFPLQLLGSSATTQTVTVTNNSSASLSGLSLRFLENDNSGATAFYPTGGDFNGVPNYREQDTCSPPTSFTLAAGASCTATISFSPQESCPWLPQAQPAGTSIQGLPPAQCPVALNATLSVTLPPGTGKDSDSILSVPVSGTGMSYITSSVPELDFGSEAVGEASQPQTVTFTNQSSLPVMILPPFPSCVYSSKFQAPGHPRPPLDQVVSGTELAEAAGIGLPNSAPIQNDAFLSPPLINAPTVQYFCDTDPPAGNGGSGQPNFQISDSCSGNVVQAQQSCSVQVTFIPQPATWAAATSAQAGLDDFLELNTNWCGDATNPPQPNCEIDSGRFPVELKTNSPSPLRMFPGAGLDFGIVARGTLSNGLAITLFNDPVDPHSATLSFTSKIVSGDYAETDNCPAALAPNQSCTITVTFGPKVVGLDPGTITIIYNIPGRTGATQTIFMRGAGQ